MKIPQRANRVIYLSDMSTFSTLVSAYLMFVNEALSAQHLFINNGAFVYKQRMTW